MAYLWLDGKEPEVDWVSHYLEYQNSLSRYWRSGFKDLEARDSMIANHKAVLDYFQKQRDKMYGGTDVQ